VAQGKECTVNFNGGIDRNISNLQVYDKNCNEIAVEFNLFDRKTIKVKSKKDYEKGKT
jgi:hypothetical protein